MLSLKVSSIYFFNWDVYLTAAERVSMETEGWVDTVKEGEKYLRAHPNLQVAAAVLHQTQDLKKPAATVSDFCTFTWYLKYT